MHHLDSPFVQASRSLVVIDRGAEDYQQLLAGVIPSAQVLLLSPDEDGIEQISRAIAQTSPSTVHLIAHGAPGCLYLGNSKLSLDTLPAHRAALSQWFQEAENPQLVIYGCRVAASDAGKELVQKLHHITDAGVSAATDAIGSASRGGSWNLDIQVATASTVPLALTSATQKNYAGVLGWVIAEKEVSLDVPQPDTQLQNDLVSLEQFGEAVSIYGDYAVVGIPFDDPVDNSPEKQAIDPANGAVYVYQQIGGAWTPIQRLTVPLEALADSTAANLDPTFSEYGAAVAMTEVPAVGGGTTARLLVGDPTGITDTNGVVAGGLEEGGRVYVYDLNPATGLFDQDPVRLQPNPEGLGDPNIPLIEFYSFGAALATSGNTILVGAPFAQAPLVPQDESSVDAGAVYSFELQNGVWTQTQKISFQNQTGPGAEVGGDRFGTSVAIDGNTMIVGAPFKEAFETPAPNETQTTPGAAYVFTRASANDSWVQDTILRGPDLFTVVQDEGTSPRFGQSVSISGDFAIVGAPKADLNVDTPNEIVDAGKAYIYERQGSGDWLLAKEVTASDASALDDFGFSVSISGEFAIIGAPTAGDRQDDNGDEAFSSGSSYILQRNAETGVWEEVDAITSPDIDRSPVVPPDNNDPILTPSIDSSNGQIIDPPDSSAPFGRSSIVNGEFNELQRTFGQSVSIYTDPDSNSPQALVGAPTDVAVLGQDDTTGQVQDTEAPIQPDPAVDGPEREDDDRDDIPSAGSVYFLRARPEVIDVIFREVTTGETVEDKVSPRGAERNEDFFASDDNVIDGYSFTIVYNDSMDPSAANQPAVTFLDPSTVDALQGDSFGPPTGEWISINGGTNNAYVITYPLLDQGVEIDNIDLEIRGARNSGGIEQEDATPATQDFLNDAFDIDTLNPFLLQNPSTLATFTTSADANRDTDAGGNPIGPRYFNTDTLTILGIVSEELSAAGVDLSQIIANNFSVGSLTGTLPNFGFSIDPNDNFQGNVGLEIAAGTFRDVAGNANAPIPIDAIYDTTGPTAETLVARNAAGAITAQPINDTSFTVTATFTDALSPRVIDAAGGPDVVVTGIDAAISSLTRVNPFAFTFTVTPTNPVGGFEGDITLAIADGAVEDLATNPNQTPDGETPVTVTVNYDTKNPTVTLATKEPTLAPIPPSSLPVVDGIFTVVATFSEAIAPGSFELIDTPTGLNPVLDDLIVTNGSILSIVDVTPVGGLPTYEIEFSPEDPDLDVSIQVRAGQAGNAVGVTDIAGNTNLASNILTFDYVPATNEAPVITLPTQADEPDEKLLVQGDETLIFADAPVGTGGIISITDPDAGSANEIRLDLSVNPAFGSLTLGNTAGLTFIRADGSPDPANIDNDGISDATISVLGTQAALNAALDGLTFDPFNIDTDATLTITVNDLGFTGPDPLNPIPEEDTETITIDIDRVLSPAEHDFDNNGTSDLIFQDGGDNFVLFLDNPSGTISVIQRGDNFAIPAGLETRGSSDFNGDGIPELVLQDAAGNVSLLSVDVTGTPPATTLTPVLPPTSVTQSQGAGWSIVGVGNFGGPVNASSGEAQADILWRNNSTGEVSIWYMNGDTFSSEVALVGPTIQDQRWQIEAVGDFNNDLEADIVWRNRTTGQNLIWLMNDETLQAAVALESISQDWTLAGSGDYNGDLNADIIWRNQGTGENVIWLMNGTSIAQRQSIGTLAGPAQIVHN